MTPDFITDQDCAVKPVRVLIVAEHASSRFGGEAALPLHYFRVLLRRGVPVWLITHARVRDELQADFPLQTDRIAYVEDGWHHRFLWKVGKFLPARLSYATVGYLSRLLTQWVQLRMAHEHISRHSITVVHQPIPVSPKEPSLLRGLGVPVVIGPMNGGMDYPPAFRNPEPGWARLLVRIGRMTSHLLNYLFSGKRDAARLLVANSRTSLALPRGVTTRVQELVENGVDLSLWRPAEQTLHDPAEHNGQTRFIFMGRLVDWKAVDLLIEAFALARKHAPISLLIIGDGPQLPLLREQAAAASLLSIHESSDDSGTVQFAGWMSQTECAMALRQQHVLVLPSLMECGGAVVLEAMAAGLPVISTAWGGPLDYLDTKCGILILPESREAMIQGLTEAMIRLARDPHERLAMGLAGREKVLREFDWEAKVDAILLIYKNVLKERRDLRA